MGFGPGGWKRTPGPASVVRQPVSLLLPKGSTLVCVSHREMPRMEVLSLHPPNVVYQKYGIRQVNPSRNIAPVHVERASKFACVVGTTVFWGFLSDVNRR